jgi:hypothetical protein
MLSSSYARQLGFDNSSGAQVAFDSSGHDAFVVWSQFDSVRLPANYHATQRQYLFVPCENVVGCTWIDGDNGWKSTTLIETDSADAFNPQVAGFGSGNAVAVWQKASVNPLQFSTHTRAGGWVAPGPINPAATASALPPVLAAADDGSAIALWIEPVAGRQTLMASKLSGTTWSAPLALDDSAGGGAENLQVVMDGSGNAIIVWTQFAAGTVGLYTRRCPPGLLTTCSAPEKISGQFVTAENPSLAGARNGDAIVVWRHTATPGGPRSLYAQHYSAANAAWSLTPAFIDNNVFSVRVAMDNRAIATVLWVKSEGGKTNLYASRFE